MLSRSRIPFRVTTLPGKAGWLGRRPNLDAKITSKEIRDLSSCWISGAEQRPIYQRPLDFRSSPSANYCNKYLIYIRYYILSNIAPHRAPHHGAIRCQLCLLNSNPSGAFWGSGTLPISTCQCASTCAVPHAGGVGPPHMDRRTTLPPAFMSRLSFTDGILGRVKFRSNRVLFTQSEWIKNLIL